jgi:hypothetical protein
MNKYNNVFNMIEKEISETYYYNLADFDNQGRRLSDGKTLREVIKSFEWAFHDAHTTEYATNLYANSRTMSLLAKSCDAAPFLLYGMELTQGQSFDASEDPVINHQMDLYSKKIYVYAIDSAFMIKFDEFGYPIMEDDEDIYPLTLLIDDNMRDDSIRLAVPTSDDTEDMDPIIINTPQFVHA